MFRRRLASPPPHVVEHGPQPPQLDSWQSTAHASVLQSCSSSSEGHEKPPCLAWFVTSRVRLCEPPPQVFVHVPHGVQAETVQ